MNKYDINMLRPRRLHGWRDNTPDIIKSDQTATEKPRRSFLLYLIPAILVIMIFGGMSLIKGYVLTKWPSNPNNYNELTLQPKTGFLDSIKNFFFRSNVVMEGQTEDRIDVLLLGIGGENHQGGYLSDTNIILSLKPSTSEIAMVSIPRDLVAKVDGYGWTKINAAHAYGEMNKNGGGGEFARQTFEKNLKIDLPYYLVIDFIAFKDIIDIVGGVEIDIPVSFIDYSYPTENYGYQTVTFKKGKEKMDGERALIFARSRHGNNGEGSDFARARRQQLVIAAVKEKVLSAGTYLNPIKLKQIFDSLTKHINTNLDFGQIMYLAGLARDTNTDNIKTLVFDNSVDGYLQNLISDDGAYMLAPHGGDYNLMSQTIENIFTATSTPSIYTLKTTPRSGDLPFPSAKIEIQNGTWRIGLAARAKQLLEDDGFAIYSIGNSTYRPVASTSIYILNNNVKTGFISALEKNLGVSATTSLPTWMSINIATSTSSTMATTTLPEQPNTVTDIVSSTASSSLYELTDDIQSFDGQTDILVILGEDYQ